MLSLIRQSRLVTRSSNLSFNLDFHFAPHVRAFASASQVVKRGSPMLRPVLRDPERPARPINPYFRKEADISGMSMTDVTKSAATTYKQMPPARRAQYEQAYLKEKAEHVKAMEAYKNSGAENAWKKKTGIAAVEAKAEAKKTAEMQKVAEKKAKATAKKMKAQAKARTLKMKTQRVLLQKRKTAAEKKVAAKKKGKSIDLKAKKAHPKAALKRIAEAQKNLDKVLRTAKRTVQKAKNTKSKAAAKRN